MKRSYAKNEIENSVKVFTQEEINRGIEKLKKRIEQVQLLKDQKINYKDQRVKNAELQIQIAVKEIFGENSPEHDRHKYHDIWYGGYNVGDGEYTKQEKFEAGIEQTILMLEGLISHLEEKKSEITPTATILKTNLTSNKRIFIVHGRDETKMGAVTDVINKLDLIPVVLKEEPNVGKTIIEKFEDNSDVGYALVLITPEDIGCYREDYKEFLSLRSRARQNVIFELGYFIGKLGRDRVCAICSEDIELPSDIHGVVYIKMDSKEWPFKLAKEIKHAGYEIDVNRLV